ncbi:hypothetical protein BHE74_00011935 [Ensete ventricosum]|nr:hypothetical protein BHE74_00011935 [Ensete ventricosum]
MPNALCVLVPWGLLVPSAFLTTLVGRSGLVLIYGKAPYRPIHTGLAADRYAGRSLPGAVAALSARGSTASRRCPLRPRVDREPSLPSPPAGRLRDIAALAARGRLSSPRWERD